MSAVDIAVLGGGLAGQAAFARASKHRAAVVLLDEAPPADPRRWGAPQDGIRVWGVAQDGHAFRLDGIGPAGATIVTARALIVCVGAHETTMPAPHRTPATEATRLLGARHRFVPECGGWVPVLDGAQRTSVARLYAAGDCAGLGGDATREGTLAAHAARTDLGLTNDPAPPTAGRIDQTAALAGYAAACAALAPETLICPCEGIPRAAIDAAIDAGAADVNQLKSYTRAGMGACQGRLCAEAIATLLASRIGDRVACGIGTARLPLRPIPMSALLGTFDYGDIPVPPPAPP